MTINTNDARALLAHFHKAANKLRWPKIVIPIEATYRKTPGRMLVIVLNGERSSNCGGLTITDGGCYPNNKYYGKITPAGVFIQGKDYIDESTEAAIIQNLLDDTVKTLACVGKAFGHCCFCQHLLTDVNSIAAGYGPICADNFGLPWGEEQELVKLTGVNHAKQSQLEGI